MRGRRLGAAGSYPAPRRTDNPEELSAELPTPDKTRRDERFPPRAEAALVPHAPIEIRVVSHPRYLAVVRAAVEAAACKLGFPSDDTAKVTLAVEEAMSNVIRHGYRGRHDGPIWVKLSPVVRGDASGVEVVIEDECEGVDLEKIRGRPLDEIRPGGLGVHIIKGVMDEAEYGHRSGRRGIRLRMVKVIRSDGAARKGPA